MIRSGQFVSLAIAMTAVASSVVFAPGAVHAQQDSGTELETSGISGDVDKPRRHFRLRNPARLDSDEAEKIYQIALPSMVKGYAASEADVGSEYRGWRRYNTKPYLSATHGNHYVNNYANDVAEEYGRFEEAERLPAGAVVAKDSFSVTEAREIVLGPLFVMVKMPEGFNYVSGDWKYVQIQPDGSILGETNGAGSERVEYCIGCHLAVEHQDHLYFIPPKYRHDPE